MGEDYSQRASAGLIISEATGIVPTIYEVVGVTPSRTVVCDRPGPDISGPYLHSQQLPGHRHGAWFAGLA
jgi:hypothetical protein